MKNDNLKRVNQAKAAKRMNLAEWRASRTHEMDLPSGLHVTVRDVDMTDMLLTGLLPQSVIDDAETAAKTSNELDLANLGKKMMKENGPEFKKMLDAIASAALIEPKIGTTANESHILADELTVDDKIAIMDFISREVEPITSFREGQAQDMASVQPGDGLREETQ